MGLHAQLETARNADFRAVALADAAKLLKVGGVGAVGDGVAVLKARAGRLVPVWLYAVVHVLREAQLVEIDANGIPHDLLHGVGGVVRVCGVNVVVGKHVHVSFLVSEGCCLARLLYTTVAAGEADGHEHKEPGYRYGQQER